MQENNLKEKTIKRPWQTNVLIGLNLIGWISFIGTSFYLSEYYLEKNIIGYSFWSYAMFATPVIFVGFFISTFLNNLIYNLIFLFFNIFLIINSLKRKQWTILIIFILTIFEFILFISLYFLKVEIAYRGEITFLGVILTKIFILYLSTSCLNHPFYNQKKVEQKS